MITATLSTLATILLVIRGWPQVSRIAVHKNVSGVSATTWTLILITHCAWSVWAVSLDVMPLLYANILAACGAAAVLLTVARFSELTFWRPVWSGVLATTVSALILMVCGSETFAIAVMVLTSIMVLPQVAKAYSSDPSGVSAVTWWLAVASATTWSSYYVLIDRMVLILPNLVLVPASLSILLRLYVAPKSKSVVPA